MPLFSKKRSTKGADGEQALVRELKDLLAAEKERDRFLLEAVKSLLIFLKDFSIELNEKDLDSHRFRQDLDDLSGHFSTIRKTRSLASIYRKYKKRIYLFITGQQAYLEAKEAELKDIIDLLTRGMAAIDADNEVFNQTVYRQTERIERLKQLEDIRKIKESLSDGVSRLRTVVREKRMRDRRRLESLSKRVTTLNRELEATRAESMTDGLTGVQNRRALDMHLNDLIEQNQAGKAPFCLLLLDIDDFKAVNDTHGHQVGDRVLVAVARQCRTVFRKNDFIGRYGGEEFAIVMPGVGIRVARKRAEQLCRRIAGTRYKLDKGPRPGILSVTVSIGLCRFQKGDAVSTVVARADKALYSAKAAGKNRVATSKRVKSFRDRTRSKAKGR